MPARDRFHNAARHALEKAGWLVTHDPFRLSIGDRNLFADLGAERLLAAERGARKICVEVKCFAGVSPVADLEEALGQFTLYELLLKGAEPDREMCLAVPVDAFADVFSEPLGQLVLHEKITLLIVFDPTEEEIVQWIP